jgi:hypothetical protein
MNNGNCLTCYSGWAVSGTTCVALTTINPYCATFSGLTCTNCNAGYYIGSNGICSVANAQCATYNMNNGNCLTCYSGWAVSGTTCVALSTINPHCLTFTGLTCNACSAGYYIGTGGICTPVNPQCATYNMNNGNCLSCYAGYAISGTTCVVAPTPVSNPWCSQYTPAGSTTCTRCYNPYYIGSNGICTPASASCNGYDMLTGHCTACYAGWHLNTTSGACA